MNIACSNCPAKYAVPDEKVRGRKVKITCKRCGATIIIDGTVSKGTAGRADSVALSAPPAPLAAPALWTVAVTEVDHQEMTAQQLVAAYKAGTIDAETFVWREGMPEWLTPFEIPEIEAALRAKGVGRPRPEAPAPAPAPAPQAPVPAASKSSGWREPGRWDGGKPGGGLTFDDVTVAMAAPKAQALLDAVSTTENAAPAQQPPANPFEEDEATIVADSSRFALAAPEEPARAAPRPAAGAGAEPRKEPLADAPAEAAPNTARSQQTPVPADKIPSMLGRPPVKVPIAPAVPPRTATKMEEGSASMTGARGESSVLFSLEQLAGKANPTLSADQEERVDPRALIGGAKSRSESAPPSLANLAAASMFTAPAMAAPDFAAPPASSKPAHFAPVASATPLAPLQPPSRGGRWVLALLFLSGGGAAAFFLMRPPPPAPAQETQVATPASAASPAPAVAAASAPAEAPATPVVSAGAPGVMAKKTGAAPAATAAGSHTIANAPPFDTEAAKAALSAAAAAVQGQCASEEGPRGSGKVTVTFVNSGQATDALVAGDFAGSAKGGCIARIFRGAHVPAFSGDIMHVSNAVQIP